MLRRLRGWPAARLAMALVAVTLAAAVGARAQDLSRGQVVEAVTLLDDATQSYALYLPSEYGHERSLPILVGFHPAARGRAIVDTYREAAEARGFIVVGSNVSRNGPWQPSLQAAMALLLDVGKRLNADGRRIYLTGHSGGARLALHLALANPQIAGVIASSAGYPDVRLRTSVPFPLFATAGSEDFNLLEMRRLSRALKTPHRLAVFEGGHTLPPAAIAREALEWLDLRAMAAGLRAPDEDLRQRMWTDRQRAADEAGTSPAAVHVLRSMSDDFRGLRDVSETDARASALARERAVARALDQEEDDEEQEAERLEEIARHEAGLSDPSVRREHMQRLRKMLAAVHAEATAADPSAVRARARRILQAVLVNSAGRPSDAEYASLLERLRHLSDD